MSPTRPQNLVNIRQQRVIGLRPAIRHGFTLGQEWQYACPPPNLSLTPESLVTATVCSSKPVNSYAGGVFGGLERIGVVRILSGCTFFPEKVSHRLYKTVQNY